MALCAMVAVGTAGLAAVGSEAGAVTATISNGEMTVSIDPTTDLSDGEVVNVSVTANGTTLNQVNVAQCAAPVENDFDFSKVGGVCSSAALSAAHRQVDFQPGAFTADDPELVRGPYAPGTTTDSFTYVVGTGTHEETSILTGATRTVRCGTGETACYLVVYIQENATPEVFHSTPLTFGSGGGSSSSSSSTSSSTTSSSTSTTSTVKSTTTSSSSSTTSTVRSTTSSTVRSTTTSSSAGSTTTVRCRDDDRGKGQGHGTKPDDDRGRGRRPGAGEGRGHDKNCHDRDHDDGHGHGHGHGQGSRSRQFDEFEQHMLRSLFGGPRGGGDRAAGAAA